MRRPTCRSSSRASSILREIFRTKPLGDIVGRELGPGAEARTDAEIGAYVRDRASGTIFHPVGTCKMGTDEMAVVDPALRVHGLDGLRVVDASIMPTLIGGNTNAPTIMIAEKAAEMMTFGHATPNSRTEGDHHARFPRRRRCPRSARRCHAEARQGRIR